MYSLVRLPTKWKAPLQRETVKKEEKRYLAHNSNLFVCYVTSFSWVFYVSCKVSGLRNKNDHSNQNLTGS